MVRTGGGQRQRGGSGWTGRHRARPRRLAVRRAPLVLLLAVTLVVGTGAIGWAAWLTPTSTAGTRQVQAATLGPATAPTPTQVAGGLTVSLTWPAVSSATSYEVRHHTAATGGTSAVVCTTTAMSCVDSTPRTGSSHWYSVTGRAGTAWVSTSARAAYVADDTTTVSIVSMSGDSGSSSTDFITRNASTTLTGTAEIGATIAVRRGGSTIATATANGSGAWTSTTFTLNEGLQDLDAVATDGFANTATATRVGVRLDTVAPVTSRTDTCSNVGNAAPSGSWCKVTSLSMTASFSDAGSGLAAGTSEFNNAGAGWTAYTGPLSLAEANGRVVGLRATDVAGNLGSSSVTYYIDGTAPNLAITAPTDGLSLSLALLGSLLSTSCGGKTACGTSSDAVSGLASVSSVTWQLKRGSQCLLAGGSYGTCTMVAAIGTLPSWTTSTSGGYSALSSYVLTVSSTDAAGNVQTVSVSFSTLL